MILRYWPLSDNVHTTDSNAQTVKEEKSTVTSFFS